jgi:hypothetical protein
MSGGRCRRLELGGQSSPQTAATQNNEDQKEHERQQSSDADPQIIAGPSAEFHLVIVQVRRVRLVRNVGAVRTSGSAMFKQMTRENGAETAAMDALEITIACA